tara:strand:+ start:302 stop:454 length:153 start_codon:yes stop_codon:yes gene_type:complete
MPRQNEVPTFLQRTQRSLVRRISNDNEKDLIIFLVIKFKNEIKIDIDMSL